jgi:hypothetical protein
VINLLNRPEPDRVVAFTSQQQTAGIFFTIGMLLCLAGLSPDLLQAANTPLLKVTFDNPASGDGGGSKGTCYSISAGKGRSSGKGLVYHQAAKGIRADGKRDNFHYDFVMPVQPQQTYVASVWFKAEGDLHPSLRIATRDWQTLASGICTDSRDWQEVRVPFQSGDQKEIRIQIFGGGKTEARETETGTSYCDDVMVALADTNDLRAMRQARVTVNAQSVLHEINPLFFGVNTLFWIEDDASLKDGKIAKYLREMPCRLMRFPGGEVGDNYHWKTRKLDNLKQFPASEGPDKLDCDKFMTLCRQVGATPIFVINLESGFIHNNLDAAIQEAADWVRYANKEKDYQVKYWEIGNETYLPVTYYPTTAREYAVAFVKFSRAMKAVDPSIKIGAVGPLEVNAIVATDRLTKTELDHERNQSRAVRRDELKKTAAAKAEKNGDAWWPTLAKVAGADLDFAIVHRYYPHVFGPDANADKPVIAFKQFLVNQFPNRTIPVALTEWNVGKETPAGLTAGLIVAELIGDYVTAGVDMACFWPMRYPGNITIRSMLDLKSNDPKPSYTVMKLYSSSMGPGSKVVASTASNKQIYTCASLSENGKKLTIFLINKTQIKDPAEIFITASGINVKSARAVTLTAPNIDSDKATLQDAPVTASGGAWMVKLPPHSVTVVTCEP